MGNTVYDCLYAGLLPNEAQNFQSADVLLGLTPTLLSTLAPSIGEISLLSTRRRLLALLLAVANPSIYVSRLLSFNDPMEYLRPVETAFPDKLLTLDGRGASVIVFLQYILAAGAIVNVVHLSWELGYRTVIAWKCNASYIPFLWTIMPLFVHVIAAVGWHMSNTVREANRSEEGVASRSKLRQMAMQEITLPSQDPKLDFNTPPTDPQGRLPSHNREKLAIFLNELAGFGAFLHLLFGTTVFSSLMFIGVLDALQVIARYISSGLICRLIVSWELAAMRAAGKESEEQADESRARVSSKVDLPERQTFPMMMTE